ncbi:MAG: hypothetical protein H6627_07480 [Calditrichae bacterium]|nr:hypothetical protein [Calditrichota bacterium]MCB9058391.1 hypothetical protein [Calditrichia bacterium]
MRSYKFLILLFLIPALTGMFMGCSDDSTSSNKVDEYAELVKYLEGEGGDFINTYAPAIKSADAVKTAMTTGTQYIIDIRSAADYATGHIDGAVNVAFGDLITHVEGLTTDYETIIIACYSGQTAAYGASLLRLLGHDNVYTLKFGMSSWNKDFDVWSAKCLNTYATQFETTVNAKGPEVDPPALDTGKKTGAEILRARVQEVLDAGFIGKIGAADVVPNASNFYIVNYWPENHYAIGHIQGAMCYVPKADLKSTTYLNTLPADKKVVVYCYTGQTSAYVTAYLRVLGYDAYSLLYGANNMIYDTIPASAFSEAAIMGYDYVTGN